MTDAVIRRAESADLAAIVQLRREWTREEAGEIEDPDFEENLAAWFAREWSRRIMWLAEEGGRPVGMMNLAIYERMPRPGRALSHWGTSATYSCARYTAIGASAVGSSVQRLIMQIETASLVSC